MYTDVKRLFWFFFWTQAGYSALMLGSLRETIKPKDKVALKRLFENGNLNCIAQSVRLEVFADFLQQTGIFSNLLCIKFSQHF